MNLLGEAMDKHRSQKQEPLEDVQEMNIPTVLAQTSECKLCKHPSILWECPQVSLYRPVLCVYTEVAWLPIMYQQALPPLRVLRVNRQVYWLSLALICMPFVQHS